jgi:short-subunit dehydrogenase
MKKYCLITGATGGLGRAFVYEAASRGYDLILTDTNNKDLENLSNGVYAKFNIKPDIVVADITKIEETKKIWLHLLNKKIRLSLVINIAGIDVEGLFELQESTDLLEIAKINVLGTLSILTECIKYQDNHLDIINIASMAGFYSMPYKAVYSATKSFIINISRSLDVELKDRNINVLAVCPAGLPTRADIIEKIDSQGVFGDLTTLNTSVVAKRAINKVKAKKQIYIPGVINQFIVGLSNIFPKKIQTFMIGKRWKKTSSRLVIKE